LTTLCTSVQKFGDNCCRTKVNRSRRSRNATSSGALALPRARRVLPPRLPGLAAPSLGAPSLGRGPFPMSRACRGALCPAPPVQTALDPAVRRPRLPGAPAEDRPPYARVHVAEDALPQVLTLPPACSSPIRPVPPCAPEAEPSVAHAPASSSLRAIRHQAMHAGIVTDP
jgi:hypothetical protein